MFNRPLVRRVEARKYVRAQSKLAGWLDATTLPDLAELSCDPESLKVEATADFVREEERFMAMHCTVNASMDVTCQRCLEALTLDLSGPFAVALVATEEQIERLPEGWEVVLLEDEEPLDVHLAIQEELLLRVPMVPKHEEMCGMQFEEQPDEPKPNPFAVLAQLKGKKD